jgi:hypothetical protein
MRPVLRSLMKGRTRWKPAPTAFEIERGLSLRKPFLGVLNFWRWAHIPIALPIGY